MTLLTIKEAADLFAVSRNHIQTLIDEADTVKNPRWKWNKELVELTPKASGKRVIRINMGAFTFWTDQDEQRWMQRRKLHSQGQPDLLQSHQAQI